MSEIPIPINKEDTYVFYSLKGSFLITRAESLNSDAFILIGNDLILFKNLKSYRANPIEKKRLKAEFYKRLRGH